MAGNESLRVEELAAAAEISVDTIRFYQKRGLLDAPRRQGRLAFYGAAHLERLQTIRRLADNGLSLAQIGEVLDGRADPLVAQLVAPVATAPALSQSDLSTESGLAPDLVALVIDAGLIRPLSESDSDVDLFPVDAVDMLKSAQLLLSAGIPVEELADMAVRHAQHVEDLAAEAVELFATHGPDAPTGPDAQDRAELVHELIPAVTTLVADHFQRTLVGAALDRLRTPRELAPDSEAQG
ncbi:MAG: MerR family transcriptional regulator [Actinomycetia bacterium]|nr:MerR family transcriptional regulator [Actinomycetes bacterium]MCP4087948.1 MerR family transcriptional regulator [Actinomycetes bacterium]